MKRTIIIVSVIMILATVLTGCTEKNADNNAPAIKSFAIGKSRGEIEQQGKGDKAVYLIRIALPEDTDFRRCTANIELQPEAEILEESPCLIDNMGGRPVLNLTRESRTLLVSYRGSIQNYEFEIEISE